MMKSMKIILVGSLFFLFIYTSCKDKPTQPQPVNPLDVNNMETGGDPFQLQATIADGGVLLNWSKVNIESVQGYNVYRSEDETTGYTSLKKVSGTTSYTDVTIKNGHSYWYKVAAYKTSGQESNPTNVAAVRVNAKPMIAINGNDEYSETRNVSLTILASTAAQMWISNNAQFSDGNWESYKTTKNWTLSTGEGRKNVYLKVKYSDDTISDISSDDILPQPMQPSIVIANDSVYTSRRNVVLSLTALGENLTMKVSQDSNFIGVSWENFAASENITLSTGEGPKIVYAKFKNDFEIESKIITDDVILDMTAPTADFSVTPNYGIVNETNYSFDASGSHDAYPVLLRWDWENDGSFDTDWLTDKTTTYQYSVGGGNKTVKLEVKDGAGNTNSTSKQIYINTRPVASFTVTQDKNNYKLYYVDASSSSDFEDGTNLEYRWDWENDGTWDINYNTTKTASYQYTDDGDKTINLEVKDTKGLAHLTETDITTVRLIVTDIDGNVYKTVKIGDQWWMAENLKVTKYRNGDPIPNVTSNSEWANLTTGAYCNYDNNDSYVSTYGRLYNWYAVNDSRGLAPAGWHVPTDAEWKQLEMYLGMSQSEANETGYRGTDEGGKLKETGTGHWSSPNTGATNESGFSGLPGGYRFHDGTFNVVGSSAYFWSASSAYSGYYAWYRPLYCNRSDVYRSGNYVQDGFSVRCVRD